MRLSRPFIFAVIVIVVILVSAVGIFYFSSHGSATLPTLQQHLPSQTIAPPALKTSQLTDTPTYSVPPTPSPTLPTLAEPLHTPTQVLPTVIPTQNNLIGVDSCAAIWGFDRPQLGIPEVLSFPISSQELHTEYDYYYLAAMLIKNKAVDPTGCLYDGLQTFTTASMCGVNAARPQLFEWQNKFDPYIFNSGTHTGIPPRLIKELFALESQFWPGYYQTISSSGLGQLNQNGADALIIYNPDYYKQLCPQVLHADACKQSYDQLSEDEKRLLRGRLVSQVNADCPTCTNGVDLDVAIASVQVFTDVIKANCRQVNNTIYNLTYVRPANLISYVDMWRLALANYNSGSGCTALALESSWTTYRDLDWAHVSQFFIARECSTALFYVNELFP